MKVFKAVNKNQNGYESWTFCGTNVIYKIGEKSIKPSTPLLVFDTLDNAADFFVDTSSKYMLDKAAIIECDCEPSEVQDFDFLDISHVPDGTICADTVTPIREVPQSDYLPNE